MSAKMKLSVQMLGMLTLLAKNGECGEPDFLGDLPRGRGFGGSFVPDNIYHSRYASVLRSLHSLQRMGLIQRERASVFQFCKLTPEGILTVKSRHLTDRKLSDQTEWMTRKQDAIKKDEELFLWALSESRKVVKE